MTHLRLHVGAFVWLCMTLTLLAGVRATASDQAPAGHQAPAGRRAATVVPATGLPAPVLALSQRLRGQTMQCVPFEQRKHLVALGRNLLFTGELSVAADHRVLWQLKTPVQAEYQFLTDGAWRRTSGAVRGA